MGQAQPQQLEAPPPVAFVHLQAAELGAGVGVAGLERQLGLHCRPQPGGLGAIGQQLGPVAVMNQGRQRAVGDAPVGFPGDQGHHAVVHHRVVLATPVDGRVAAKQPAHI